MRDMKAFRMVVVAFLMLLAAQQVYADVSAVTDPVERLLEQAWRAESSGRLEVAEDKLLQVLKTDKDHYQALVGLAQIQMKKAGDSVGIRVLKDCEHHLLRAAINQPHRPEAYLVLAQLKYRAGEITEGDTYVRWARDREPAGREAYALLGQRYERSSNYAAATKEYETALSYIPFDPYFLSRRYWAASSITTSQWVSEFIPYWQIVDVFDRFSPLLAPKVNYHPDAVRRIIYELFKTNLVADFRSKAGKVSDVSDQYSLPDFTFGYCRLQDRPSNDFADLYEGFIKASVESVGDYERLRGKVNDLRNEALKAVENHRSPKQRGKALYTWLKTRVLKNYDKEKGTTAEEVLDHQRYLGLSASILYTLFGRDADLTVDGEITLGHAYAILGLPERDVRVEMIADPIFGVQKEEGFDIDPWVQFELLSHPSANGGLQGGTSSRNMGKVTPTELTAYQFLNVFAHNEHKIRSQLVEESKEIVSLKEELRDRIVELGERLQELDRMTDKDAGEIAELRAATIERYENSFTEIQDRIFRVEHRIRKQITDFQYEEGRKLIQNARSLSPHTEEFARVAENIYIHKAISDALPLMEATRKRENRRMKLELERRAAIRSMSQPEKEGKGSKKKASGKTKTAKSSAEDEEALKDTDRARTEQVAQVDRRLERIRIEERDGWDTDKVVWMGALNVLDKGVDALPCGLRVKRILENMCTHVVTLASANGDPITREAVVAIGRKRLPDARFVKESFETAPDDH